MTTSNKTFSLRFVAILAGLSLIIMAIAAGFSVGFVQSSLLVEGDGIQTMNNLQESKNLFISGIGAWIVIFITDVLVAWALYVFFKPINNKGSLITATLRILYSIILLISIYQLIQILPYISAEGSSLNDSADEVLAKFSSAENIWSQGLILFGFHLLGLGLLSLKSVKIHRIFGFLLLIAGAGYIVVHTGKQMTGIDQELVGKLEMILALPMAAGELLFGFWLLIRGGKN